MHQRPKRRDIELPRPLQCVEEANVIARPRRVMDIRQRCNPVPLATLKNREPRRFDRAAICVVILSQPSIRVRSGALLYSVKKRDTLVPKGSGKTVYVKRSGNDRLREATPWN